VIINNYNYGRFLRECIDSALDQTYPHTEVIVVDDGSTDNSREIIGNYGCLVTPVLKQNGGQASSFNAGIGACRGDVICFLDSDDVLAPTAMEKAVDILCEGIVKVHWPLWEVDTRGRKTGNLIPREALSAGDLREVVRRAGPWSWITPPTSGNAWARWFVERIFPMPEAEYRICADTYLVALAPLFGPIRSVSLPQGSYRIHGESNFRGRSFDEKLREGVRVYDQQCRAITNQFRDMGVSTEAEAWKRSSWLHWLHAATEQIAEVVPSGDLVILVDEEQWGTDGMVGGRRRVPFLERDGQYWGPPPDDATAIGELERLRGAGARFIAFAWPAFWWLDHYAGMREHLRSTYRCVLENDRLVVFDLRR
jgi:hypothetical protein